MVAPGINLVMAVIGFALSIMFIVFVCTRLIWARIHLSATRRYFARQNRSDQSNLERGCHGPETLIPANFPTKKYKELCLSSKENASHRCAICLADYHEEDSVYILPVCRHFFHTTCIGIWLQQHSTCPVCRISLQELPERKWFMQPMFSSALRSQYNMQSHYCHCMAGNSSGQYSSRSGDDAIRDVRCHSVRLGDDRSDSVPVDHHHHHHQQQGNKDSSSKRTVGSSSD